MTVLQHSKYILITGADSGVGIGLIHRFLEFMTNQQHDSDLKLYLILCGLHPDRHQASVEPLKRKYQRVLKEGRVEMSYLDFDLSRPEGIYKAVQWLESFPRIDVFYANAGAVLVQGLNLVNGMKEFLKEPITLFTDLGTVLVQKTGVKTPEGLGFHFAVNVFGHYTLLTELLEKKPVKRVVWVSSLTSHYEYLDWNDLQGIQNEHSYEASKLLVEFLAVAFQNRIESFVSEPGVVASSIVYHQIPKWVYYFLMIPVFYLGRLLLTCLTLTVWYGAYSEFYLSSLYENSKVKKNEKYSVLLPNKKPETGVKYSSSYHYWKGEFVQQNALIKGMDVVEKEKYLQKAYFVENYMKQLKEKWYPYSEKKVVEVKNNEQVKEEVEKSHEKLENDSEDVILKSNQRQKSIKKRNKKKNVVAH